MGPDPKSFWPILKYFPNVVRKPKDRNSLFGASELANTPMLNTAETTHRDTQKTREEKDYIVVYSFIDFRSKKSVNKKKEKLITVFVMAKRTSLSTQWKTYL